MGKWTGKRVAVLYGGKSSERDVSLKTGAAIAKALQETGHDVALIDVDGDVAADFTYAVIRYLEDPSLLFGEVGT